MPGFGAATPVDSVNASVSLLDMSGSVFGVSLDKIEATVTQAEFDTLRDAIAGGSNAALLSGNFSSKSSISKAAASNAMFDDGYAHGSVKAVFVFEDNAGNQRSFSVPAPDASMFGSDNKTIDIANSTEASAIASAGTAFFNGGSAGSGTFAFVRGYLSGRTVSAPPQVITTNPQEPGAGASPPDDPGT